jgi:hypothetical protein
MPLTVELPGANRPAVNQIEIGLINSMPDAALEATESQFTALLAAGAGQAPWRAAAVRIYRNGLSYVKNAKDCTPLAPYLELSSEQA